MNLQPIRYDNIGEAGDARLRHARTVGQSSADKSSASRSTSGKGDTLAPAIMTKLMDVLKNSAEVRPEVVERGRALAADPHYPSADVFREIAKRLLNG